MSAAPRADLVIDNIGELLTCEQSAPDLIGRVRGGAVAVSGDRIVAVGPAAAVWERVDASAARVIDARGVVVMPGFVDSHTHLVFGGSRADEYATRLTGGDIEALRRRGTPVGIAGTVGATRARTNEQLVEEALPRLAEMLRCGTTTVESKSGYGLTVESEVRLLEVNRRLDECQPVDIVSTLLGAHAVPPEQTAEAYVDAIVGDLIPRVASEGLAEFCDAYCEEGYFTLEQTRRVLAAGLEHGLRPKIHLDQYGHTGAAAVTAELGAVSADHLNYTTPAEIERLAAAGVVAVAMPAIDFAVAHPMPIDIRQLIDGGMTVALATDLCPGCWLTSMQFVMTLACRLHRLSVAEAIRAATLGGAKAVGRETEIGSLERGKLADLLILDVERHEDLVYRLGRNAVATVVKRGKVVVPQA